MVYEEGNQTHVFMTPYTWVVKAVSFLRHSYLAQCDRAWIQGLLYGIQESQIEEFFVDCLKNAELPKG